MKVTPIKDILKMDKDDEVEATKGSITKIFEVKEVGRGTLQSVNIEDGGKEIMLKLWDHDEVPKNWRGKFIHIVANPDEKKGKLVVDEYKGKIQLQVQKDAEITLGTRVTADEPEPGEEDYAPQRKNETPPADNEAENPDDPKTARMNVYNARVFLARCANLYILAMQAGDYVSKWFQANHEKAVDSEVYKAMVHGFYMDARMGGGWASKMPKHDLAPYLKANGQPKPAEAPKAPEKKKAGVQDQLADIIVKADFTFDEFWRWACESGNIEPVRECGGFVEMTEAEAKFFVKNKTGVLQQIGDWKKEGVA